MPTLCGKLKAEWSQRSLLLRQPLQRAESTDAAYTTADSVAAEPGSVAVEPATQLGTSLSSHTQSTERDNQSEEKYAVVAESADKNNERDNPDRSKAVENRPIVVMTRRVQAMEQRTVMEELYALLPIPRGMPHLYWKAAKLTKRALKNAAVHELNTTVDERPFAHVNINNIELRGLLDSGATISCLGKNAHQTLARLKIMPKVFHSSVQTAAGDGQSISGYADVTICYGGLEKNLRLFVIPTLSQELYLGVDFWKAFGLLPLRFVEEINSPPEAKSDKHALTLGQQKKLEDIIELFPSSAVEGLGMTPLLKHAIDTGDALPIKQRHYPISPAVQSLMYAELDRMLELGVIELSQSPWNSPISMVRKPNGKARLCLDARAVNLVTKKDAYPMPIIEGVLSRLKETYYISSVDLKDAFWQIELAEGSREKTAFSVPGRPHYQFRRMPFGLCNSAQSMCRLMDVVIPAHLREHVFVYIDDLLVVSADIESHFDRLRQVAESLRRANLTINVEKSHFLMTSIKYLGHIVGGGCIKADPDRVKAIIEYPIPKTVRQIRSFLGMAGWYQRYIANFSAIAAPITDLMKANQKFLWTPEAQSAFETLKNSLTSAPLLTHPDFTRPFIIQCDASITGVGSVLFQLDEEGHERPIAFMSKKLNAAQRNYTITELECLAAVLSIKRFRGYIEGMEFKVITDHASLKWLMGQRDLSGRLARWSLKLQCFNFTIEHRKGSANIVPDALSRVFVEEVASDDEVLTIDLESPAFKDEEYAELCQTVENNQARLPDVRLVEGKVYRREEFSTGDVKLDATMWKLWVPKAIRDGLLHAAHCPPMVSHGGVAKTVERLRRHFYWPGMTVDVRRMVGDCTTCGETKAPNVTLRPPMGKQISTERPFQFVYTDLLGPYPRSKLGHTNILVVLDKFSKFVLLQPLRKASAKEVVEFIEQRVVQMFGAPEVLYSDNGVQYKSKEFAAMVQRYGIKHMTSATHAPQANASERANRSILAAVRSYIDGNQNTWDAKLQAIASALRSSVHSSTKCSPYYTLFGQHMVQHGSVYKLLRTLQGLSSGEMEVLPAAEYRDVIHENIKKNLQTAHDRHERVYNTRSREVVFQPGQEVYRRNFAQSDFSKGFNAKLGRQWLKGRVVRKIGTAMYEMEDLAGKALNIPYHAKDLKA